MDYKKIISGLLRDDILWLNDYYYYIKESYSFKNNVYLESFYDSLFEVDKRKGYTDSIGNTICAFLNTQGGVIRIENNGKDNAEEIEKELRVLYNRFNYNPSEWISVKEQKPSGYINVNVSLPKDQEVKIYEFDSKTYYRENHKNRILKNSDIKIIVNIKRKALGLPVFTDYKPSKETKTITKEDFEKIKRNNNVSYLRIGDVPKSRSTFYKYMALDTALTIFRKEQNSQAIQKLKKQGQRNPPQTMRFVEPSFWNDQFERRFYTADYSKVNKNPDNTPKLYATCFTPRKESEPAWLVYNQEKDGLGKRCVQFCINQVALRTELVKNLKDCTVVEGSVHYLSTYEIETCHLSKDKDGNSNKSFIKRFSNFSLENYIELMLLKRTAFEHEQEVRILIIDSKDKTGRKAKTKEKAKHKDVSLDWLSFLEGIKVDPKCSDIEIKLFQDEINRLIEDSPKSKKKKKDLRNKLKVSRYDVNKDIENGERLPIGETYKQYEERLLKLQSKK